MTGATAKYLIPYSQPADTVASIAATMQNLAARTDLLLGEAGSFSAVLTAGTALVTPITLARTYPGNVGGSVPGIAIVTAASQIAATITCNTWLTSWVGTASTITGFSVGIQSNTTMTRTFLWRFFPVL